MNRKAGLFTLWAEALAFALLIIGFVFSFTTVGSSAMSYIVIFLWGMMFGRLWYRMRTSFRFPLVIIILGFLIGYIAATYIHNYGKPAFLVILFLVGMAVSHKLHSTKTIRGYYRK